MNDKIRQAFDQVQAENELKDKTKDFIFQKTKGYKQEKTANFKYLASAFACVAFLLIGGYWLYFTPTVQISIDINPSVELGVNRFNRIISFESYNDDGKELTDSLDIKFMDYSEAVNKIIDSEEILTLLENNEVMTIPLSEQTTYNPKRSFPICSPVQLEETIPIVIILIRKKWKKRMKAVFPMENTKHF